MKWEDVRKSKNVQDRRNQSRGISFPGTSGSRGRSSGGGLGGGLIWLLLSRTSGKMKLILLGLFLFLTFLGSGGLGNLNNSTIYNRDIIPSEEVSVDNSINSTNTDSQTLNASDDEVQFFQAVLATTEDYWHSMFDSMGKTYREPSLVIYTDSISTGGCGVGSTQAGPFYCPADETVYIDLQFYRDLTTKYNAPGDFAMAYVIAHEVGHHVQKLVGTMDDYNSVRQRMSTKQANDLAVRLELQADYYAGAWADYVKQEGLLEMGDIEEALQAAHSVGDDTLQKEAYGYVVPDSFTHGSSEQRRTWFLRGFEYADFQHGDTFNTDI